MSNDQTELQSILPCAACGGKEQFIESSRPEGRMSDIWRVACPCGNASAMWSVSKPAAIRLWNQYMAEENKMRRR